VVNDNELKVLGRIANALERIAESMEEVAGNQGRVIGMNPEAESFIRVVTGARTS
jgi:hypothetical protein